MSEPSTASAQFRVLQQRFPWLLIAVYGCALVFPAPGIWLRGQRLPYFEQISFAQLLVAFMLLNVGLAIEWRDIVAVSRFALTGCLAVATKLVVSFSFVCLVAIASQWLLGGSECDAIILGLLLIAGTPAANSSPAWCQQIGGNLTLSLLILLATSLLSPFWAPALLHFFEQSRLLTDTTLLHLMREHCTTSLMFWSVVVPTAAGILLRAADRWLGLWKRNQSLLRAVNALALLLLTYIFAADSLSQLTFIQPHILLLTTLLAVGQCLANFGAGAILGHIAAVRPEERRAILFGVGMHNNGVALISTGTIQSPLIIMPMLIYILAQHLCASLITWHAFRFCQKQSDQLPAVEVIAEPRPTNACWQSPHCGPAAVQPAQTPPRESQRS